MITQDKIKVMQAYVDGKTIEVLKLDHNRTGPGSRGWEVFDVQEWGSPKWNWTDFNYRVKTTCQCCCSCCNKGC